jgi:hypothetical protein
MATGFDRQLLERVVFDSADQFVLAQLRGASYYTIARNVRPDEVGESYDGPVWTVVRINDPDRDEQRKPESSWRLYYINTATLDRQDRFRGCRGKDRSHLEWMDHKRWRDITVQHYLDTQRSNDHGIQPYNPCRI